MSHLICLLIFISLIPTSLDAGPLELWPEPLDEELALGALDEVDVREALDFSQRELQERFNTGASLDVGLVYPWSKLGVSVFWRYSAWIGTFSLGSGDFNFSGNLNERNYLVSGQTQASHLASRYFIFGMGPIYVEPNLSLVRWNGTIKPRGNDAIDDVAASSLTSQFDAIGIDLGANIGLMWIFKNAFFVDYNFFQLSRAHLLKENYTAQTNDARLAIRSQIASFISMSSVNFRLGYALDF